MDQNLVNCFKNAFLHFSDPSSSRTMNGQSFCCNCPCHRFCDRFSSLQRPPSFPPFFSFPPPPPPPPPSFPHPTPYFSPALPFLPQSSSSSFPLPTYPPPYPPTTFPFSPSSSSSSSSSFSSSSSSQVPQTRFSQIPQKLTHRQDKQTKSPPTKKRKIKGVDSSGQKSCVGSGSFVLNLEWAERFAETAQRRKKRKQDLEKEADLRRMTDRMEAQKAQEEKKRNLFGEETHQSRSLKRLEGSLNSTFDRWMDQHSPSFWPQIPLKF